MRDSGKGYWYFDDEDFDGIGVVLAGKLFESSGEIRTSMRFRDENGNESAKYGGDYIRTFAEEDGWQRTHSHEYTQEIYTVHSGVICIARFYDVNYSECEVLGPGDSTIVKSGEIHNVYQFAEAIFGTEKVILEEFEGRDWIQHKGHDLYLPSAESMESNRKQWEQERS